MRAYVFTLDVLLAVSIALIGLSILSVSHETKSDLPLHIAAEDSLAVLKRSEILQSLNPTLIDHSLKDLVPNYHLRIYQYDDVSTSLINETNMGDTSGPDAVVAKASWVDKNYYYLAVMEVWQ